MKNKTIKTRLAPSPTGMFHIGTARTALFNFLFANHACRQAGKNHGKFILRFEDTDRKRSKKEYEKDILDGLAWLGLNFDERIYYQTEDLKKYQKYVDKLLKGDKAYKKDGAVWFQIESYPNDFIKYQDLILGEIEFQKEAFNDFVIIKSNGIPSFMFGNAIDDYENKISHVIRGTEHINSTPQQIMLYESLNLPVPQFAHIPLILNSDRSKMSKRKDPVSVSRDFHDQGYLPEAMINYMAFLGWNPKDNREFFTLSELVDEFDLAKVNKSGAVFDIEKLNYFNNHYIKTSSVDKLMKLIYNFPIRQAQGRQFPILPVGRQVSNKIPNPKSQIRNKDENLIKRIITVVRERMQKLSDFESLSIFFFKLPEYKSELLVFKKSDKDKTLQGLISVYNTLLASKEEIWKDKNTLNEILLEVVKANQLGNGDVFWPVRVALSGLDRSPSPPEILWVLEKEESIKRIELAINKLK